MKVKCVASVIVVAGLSASAESQTILYRFEGNTFGDAFSRGVGGAGDVNRDGFDDVIVGANQGDAFFAQGPGYARVFSGKNGDILFEFVGEATDDNFGWRVDGVGDVNGDGFPDLAVGAPGIIGFPRPGYVKVYSGQDGSELYTLQGLSQDDHFGLGLSGAGDVNGDGFDDVIVGAPFDDPGGAESGAAFVFSGIDGSVLYEFDGQTDDEFLGCSVSGVGDINGDGFDDVVVGADWEDTAGPNAGSAFVFSGFDGSTLYQFTGDAPNESFGRSVSGAGDVNGDGVPDVIVGALPEVTGGLARVHSGADGSLLYKFIGDSNSITFGWAVSGAGDVDNDGYDDLLVGDFIDASGGLEAGKVWLYSGRNGANLYSHEGMSADVFGNFVSDAGDVNGDGFADFVSGGYNDDAGYALVFSGQQCRADWSNYGSGWPGTLGEPTFTASAPPVLCATIDLAIDNSLGTPTTGTVIIGTDFVIQGTPLGGTLLALPSFFLPVSLPATGLILPAPVPCVSAFCGTEVFLQTLQLDPGASQGVSFTPGLRLLIGGGS